jgi:hypothetical protein
MVPDAKRAASCFPSGAPPPPWWGYPHHAPALRQEPLHDQVGGVVQAAQRLRRGRRVLRVQRHPEQQRAQQCLRPPVQVRPGSEQRGVTAAPGQRVDHDHGGGPLHRPPERHQVENRRRRVTVEEHGAEQVRVHHLGGQPDLAAVAGQVVEQQTAGGRFHRDGPLTPGGRVGARGQAVAVVEQPGPAYRGRRGVQPQRGRDQLVVARLRGAADVLARRVTRHHPAAVRGAQRPGHPQPVDLQGVQHPGRPGCQRVVGDRSDQHVGAAPGRDAAHHDRLDVGLADPERGAHVVRQTGAGIGRQDRRCSRTGHRVRRRATGTIRRGTHNRARYRRTTHHPGYATPSREPVPPVGLGDATKGPDHGE